MPFSINLVDQIIYIANMSTLLRLKWIRSLKVNKSFCLIFLVLRHITSCGKLQSIINKTKNIQTNGIFHPCFKDTKLLFNGSNSFQLSRHFCSKTENKSNADFEKPVHQQLSTKHLEMDIWQQHLVQWPAFMFFKTHRYWMISVISLQN